MQERTVAAQFVHLSVGFGMYPWQTFHNSSASMGHSRVRRKNFHWTCDSAGVLELLRNVY